MKLSLSNLQALQTHAEIPHYNRSNLSAGILHIGVGNFHRAHQAWYLHRLMQDGRDLNWAIIGAGVRESDAIMRDKLMQQDYLTTLIELDPKGTKAEIVGSMINFIPVTNGHADMITQMSNPDIRIVSLTVTEGGYYIDPVTKGFDRNDAGIQHDIANPDRPKTVFGAMVNALKIRRANGAGPFTAQSCDNLQGNGNILRRTLVSLANETDADLADWIDQQCSFPNSMVDCIVPATGPEERALVAGLGIEDAVPVTHENFRQWVIEDRFCQGRPAWEQVGVTFTDNVHTYEAMKIRILNGGHQIVANPAELLGLHTIADAMAHSGIRSLFRRIAETEIAPHVAAVPDMTPQDYVSLVDRRFSNPMIKDTARRVAFDGSSRHPGFIIPSIQNGLSSGTPIAGLALTSAFWARYCLGYRENGALIEANDPHWDRLQVTANLAKTDPTRWLTDNPFYGEIAKNERFATAFVSAYHTIAQHGVEAAISAYLSA